MAVLLRPRHWGQNKPSTGADVNWEHPLARGLVLCVPYAEGAGTPQELASGARFTNKNSFTTTWEATGFKTIGATSAVQCALPDAPFIRTTGLSIVWRGTRTGTTGAPMAMASKSATNGSINTPFDFGSQDNTAVTFGRATSGAGTYRYWKASSGSALPAVGVTTQIAVTLADNLVQTAPTWYFNNGVGVGSVAGPFTTGSTGAAAGSGSNLFVGTRGDDGLDHVGRHDYLYIYDRPLTAEEIRWLYVEPYAMLQQPRKLWLSPPGSGVSASGSVGLSFALTGTGLKKVARSGSVGLSEALTGSALHKATVAGSLGVSFALIGTGVKKVSAAGSVGAGWSLTGTGTRAGGNPTASGSVVLTFALAGSGAKKSTATGSVGLSEALTGVGAKKSSGAGSAVLSLVLSGVGINPDNRDWIVHRPNTGTTARPSSGTVTRPRTYA